MAPDVPASARVPKSSSSSLRWTLAADASSAEVTIGRKIMFLGEKDNERRGVDRSTRLASPPTPATTAGPKHRREVEAS